MKLKLVEDALWVWLADFYKKYTVLISRFVLKGSDHVAENFAN